VVICAHADRRWPDLQRAVASVLGQSRPARELIVVVDHNDDLLDRARRAFAAEDAGPAVITRVMASTRTRGLAGARNTGAAAATGSIVAFMDDDAEALPDWLEQLARAYATADVLGVGGRIEPVWQDGRPDWFPPEFDWVVGCSYEGLPDRPARVRNLIGANMSVRSDVLRAAGGFDESMGRRGDFGACEETEFCIRAGLRHPDRAWLFWPAARVRHAVPQDRADFTYFRRRCQDEGVQKARIVELSESGAPLSSEQDYVRRVLPRGVLRNVGGALDGRPGGLARAGAIVAGLGLTGSSYLRTRAQRSVKGTALVAGGAGARRERPS